MCPFAPPLWALLQVGRHIRRWLLRQGLRTRPSFSPPSHSRCVSPALARLCQLLALSGFTRPKRYSIVSDFATWNFSKISFCSSVKVFAKSSWCLAMYPSSSFISFEFVLLSSCGMMFPCHSSFIILFIGCTSVSTTTYHRRERKASTFSKINLKFSRAFSLTAEPQILKLWKWACNCIECVVFILRIAELCIRRHAKIFHHIARQRRAMWCAVD